MAFGDIFLADLRAYREKNLARIDMTAEFPIWQRDTRELSRHFQAEKFRAVTACIDPRVLPRTFAGRELDASFFADLPPTADPCGENGEFHTFVFDGPIFSRANPIPHRRSRRTRQFYFLRFVATGGKNKMNSDTLQKERLVIRTIVILAMIALAAVLRILPHPWNFTPVGAMALFAGAVIKDRRVAFLFPLVALFVGDIFVGFHKLMPLVYASFLIDVALGYAIRNHRTLARIGGITMLGAVQFFLVTNFGVWAFLDGFPRLRLGLIACYVAGLPLLLNTLAGDAFYATLLFGGFALAERVFPILRDSSRLITADAND